MCKDVVYVTFFLLLFSEKSFKNLMKINMRLPYDLIIECKLQPIWLHTHTHGSAGILSKKNSIQSSWKEWNKKK